MDQASKLTAYAYAVEQERKCEDVLSFLRNLLGTYEFDRNTTVSFIVGYAAAMKAIVRQREL